MTTVQKQITKEVRTHRENRVQIDLLEEEAAAPAARAMTCCEKAVALALLNYRDPLRETRHKAVERVQGGETYLVVSQSLGVSDKTVAVWCRKAGVVSARCARKPSVHRDEHLKEAVVECVRRGAMYTEAAKKFNVSSTSVVVWCRKKGVQSIYAYKNAICDELPK